MNPTKFRVSSKLNLIKIITENPGISLSKLQNYSGHKNTEQLKKDLGELFMVGSFPYTPADYIEIDFNENETLNINLPVNLDKTIGLTINEWFAIRKILEEEIQHSELEESYRVHYKSILEKIKKIIPYSEAKENETVRLLIEEAIQKKKKITFLYTGWKSNEKESRIVDPWFIFTEKNEYLVAYCNDRKGRRNFRLASISSLRILEQSISNPLVASEQNKHILEFNQFLNQSEENSEVAEILLDKEIEYNFSRQAKLEILGHRKIGTKEYIHVKTKITEKNWFLDLVKGFGEKVILISPEFLKTEYLTDLENMKLPIYLTSE
ncbi:MAG: WYL domain-containing protein [Leptospiraceae bacterium]|nr:WYL domain-containing protein [Leptospiraceae bacterium]